MASTKSNSVHFNAQSLTAGAGDQTSTAQDLSTGYGAFANIKLTNGATGPTVPAQVKVQYSNDNTVWFDGPTFVGTSTNSAVSMWSFDVPIGVQRIRFVAGSNTTQAVTVHVDCSNVTGI